jgi:hypothetical protein
MRRGGGGGTRDGGRRDGRGGERGRAVGGGYKIPITSVRGKGGERAKLALGAASAPRQQYAITMRARCLCAIASREIDEHSARGVRGERRAERVGMRKFSCRSMPLRSRGNFSLQGKARQLNFSPWLLHTQTVATKSREGSIYTCAHAEQEAILYLGRNYLIGKKGPGQRSCTARR